jgi:FHA domain-containing protein
MITLTVTSFKGNAVANPPVSFDELGGTIGRADTNQLVLPDPERAISRIHAQVVYRNGAYGLIGRGGNAVLHNGSPVGHGAEVMLAQGDQVVIGHYHISVSTALPDAGASDSFDAAFGNTTPTASPVSVVSKSPPPAPAPVAAPRPGPRVAATPPAGQSGFGIPDDWDPFAHSPAADPFGEIPGGSSSARGQSPTGARKEAPVSTPAREDSLDALFGLKAGAASSDPFADSPLAHVAQPNTAGSADPLRALQQAPQAAAQVESDHVSDLNAPWVNARQPAKAPAAAAGTPLPGAVLSWDASSRAPKAGAAPPISQAPVAPRLTPAALPTPMPMPMPAPPAMPASLPELEQLRVTPPPRPVSHLPSEPNPAAGNLMPAAQDGELLEALLEGLGTPDLRIGALNPEMMRQLGQLLRESTKGTVELLAARAALKREVRADVTTILASANNSLKFSPSVEVALQYLLGPKMMGFMPPVESMRDAYDDLKAHQLGVMAGMKAALAGVLERFDPKVVEGKLTAGSALSNLIPSSRKARLWELFQEVYQKLATEAEEDFNTLFGAAFLKAYQQYIDQLEGRDTRK